MKEIDKYMTVAEAVHRYGISRHTIKDRLAMRTDDAKRDVQALIDAGYIKYFKAPDAQRGEWIVTTTAMEKLFKKIVKRVYNHPKGW